MTPEQETRGAELFAQGKSERQVATELGVGTGSAHRLRMRLAAKAEAGGDSTEPVPDVPVDLEPVTPDDGGHADADLAAELAELETQRGELDRIAGVHEERAQASRSAVMELEAERLAALEAGRDAAPLRPRIASACADADDSATAAQMVRGRVAVIDERIAEIKGCRELAVLRAELAAAVAERDEVCARSGQRQRAAVLAVREVAEEFTATYREEEAAGRRMEQLAQAVAAGAAGFVSRCRTCRHRSAQRSRCGGTRWGAPSWRSCAPAGGPERATPRRSRCSSPRRSAGCPRLRRSRRRSGSASGGCAPRSLHRSGASRGPGRTCPRSTSASTAARSTSRGTRRTRWTATGVGHPRRRVVRAGLPHLMRSRPWLLMPFPFRSLAGGAAGRSADSHREARVGVRGDGQPVRLEQI